MRTTGDWELLQGYVKTRSEEAFAELVRRHIDWVYSVARRRVVDSQLAEDVAQSVFALLARKAASLRAGTVLGGWLFRSTCFVSKCALRAEQRRKNREEMASAMMICAGNDENDVLWEQLAPHVDQAVASLSEADRAAVLLRFYEKASLAEVGQRAGISEEAAKKRVSRAVEKLRNILARRGVTVGAGVLGVLLAEKTVQAAPASLTGAVLHSSTTCASAALPQLARDTLSAWRWLKLKLATAAGVSAMLLFLTGSHLSHSRSAVTGQAAKGNRPTVEASKAALQTDARVEATPAAEAGAARLLFRVIAADSGRGIEATRIPVNYVTGGEWIRRDDLVTDKEGYCSVPLPAADVGRLDVGALKDGFVQKFYTWREDYGTPLPSSYIIKLERAVGIGGNVRDSAGNPVSNAEIGLGFYGTGDASFREPMPERLGFVGDPVTAVRTDSQGNWHCALTPPGYTDCSIEVRHPNYVQQTFSKLPMEELWAGKAVMVLEPGYELRGLVLDDTGNPVIGARVTEMGTLNYRQDGFKTSRDGSFHMTGLAAGTANISAWAKGFAPSLTSVPISSRSQQVVFRLNRGATVPVRVVDDEGTAIAGAFVAAELPTQHNADFRATTDADGRAHFDGIPTNAISGLAFHAGAKGYFYSRNVRSSPGEPETNIRLVKSLSVSGSVLDADSGQPVMDFKAIPCNGEDSSGYDRSATRHGQLGAYAVDFSEARGPFRVRIEAEGYETAISPPMGLRPAEQTQDFFLQKKDANRSIRGVVLMPDGRPGGNVSVALLTFEQGATLYHGTFKRESDAIVATTSDQGEFTFDPAAQAHTLVAADPANGFARLRMHRATQPFRLQLQPWGRIEGRIVLGGAPAPNQQVFVNTGLPSYRSVRDGLYGGFDFATTDAEGRFAYEQVPPGDVTLYVSTGPGQPLSYQTVAEVRAGETVQVQIGGHGRLITGRLAMSDATQVDWTAQLMTASLVTNLKRPAIQPPPDSHDFAGRLRLLDFFDNSEDWRAFERSSGSFPLQVAADGSFTVQDVPPGPYQLSATLSDSPSSAQDLMQKLRRRIAASVKADVIVPEASGDLIPIDLGTFRLKPNSFSHK
jgi:RNA polymerase sigma factor (sigma-70 family)